MARVGAIASCAWVVLAVWTALSPPARAEDEAGMFAIKGAGFATCDTYLEERDTKSSRFHQFGGWINGYLTAINELSPETFDLVAWESPDMLAAFVANYCTRFPDRRFYLAVRALADVLQGDRLKRHSPPVEARVGDQTVVVYETTMQRLQRALSEEGYYRAEIDGAYGPATRRAIEAFQREEDLPVTGLPDQRTLHAVFRGTEG